MAAVIDLEHVSFGYHNSPVLKDINFQVNSGEFVGIIGPNGGGKTTLLRLIMGFLKPTSGNIKIFDRPSQAAANQLAYVPQTTRFDKQFPISVWEVVLSGRLSHLPWYGIYRKIDKVAALEALEKVSMLEFQNKAFGTLSGGQAQRVLIARALASHPKLLLLDEPTASVDAQAETEIYNLLKELRGKMTILMVTHNLQVAIKLVDRVLCVRGEVIAIKTEEVCEHFALGLYHTPLINIKHDLIF